MQESKGVITMAPIKRFTQGTRAGKNIVLRCKSLFDDAERQAACAVGAQKAIFELEKAYTDTRKMLDEATARDITFADPFVELSPFLNKLHDTLEAPKRKR